jgi:hypothetical protein
MEEAGREIVDVASLGFQKIIWNSRAQETEISLKHGFIIFKLSTPRIMPPMIRCN